MLVATSCSDSGLTDLIDASRQRLAVIGVALSLLTITAAGLVAETRWESDAARGFGSDADHIACLVTRLVDQIDQLRDDLAVIRPALAAISSGCG